MSVIVAFDVGTSGSKVIASFPCPEFPFETVERHFLVPPAVRELTQSTYEDSLEERYGKSQFSSSFVSYVDPTSGDRVYWEVGETATRPGLLPVGDRKFEKCLAKVLSFLGYLVQVEMETNDRVPLCLGLLLPFDEIGDRQLLARWLRETVGQFEFNGTAIQNIELESIDCKPEGYGIHKAYDAERVLIVGHSDSSWLCFNRGALNTKLSCTLPETGMHDFIQTLNFPITYELRAAELLSLAGPKLNPKYLFELTQTRSSAEIERLREAIQQAKRQYWIDRRSEFSSLNVSGVERVPVSGGAANYFTTELNQMFLELFGIKLHWCKDLMLEFLERFEIQQKTDLLHRFADCYGYFRDMPGVEGYEAKAVEVVGGAAHA
ncbi:MAG: hypothetical protein KME35_24350 [Aphanocapsa sp. GSE-SYN-MK-11-07L]|jgi:hypothetical protein|nr:hypothetical protein [Aphanocapsa sp. GSE-SYN-MK-11-07L]